MLVGREGLALTATVSAALFSHCPDPSEAFGSRRPSFLLSLLAQVGNIQWTTLIFIVSLLRTSSLSQLLPRSITRKTRALLLSLTPQDHLYPSLGLLHPLDHALRVLTRAQEHPTTISLQALLLAHLQPRSTLESLARRPALDYASCSSPGPLSFSTLSPVSRSSPPSLSIERNSSLVSLLCFETQS